MHILYTPLSKRNLNFFVKIFFIYFFLWKYRWNYNIMASFCSDVTLTHISSWWPPIEHIFGIAMRTWFYCFEKETLSARNNLLASIRFIFMVRVLKDTIVLEGAGSIPSLVMVNLFWLKINHDGKKWQIFESLELKCPWVRKIFPNIHI